MSAMAIIHKPAKTAMQSGQGKTDQWVLEFLDSGERWIEPMMGWTASRDMRYNEIKLFFPSQEVAENYAKKNNIPYEITQPKSSKIRPKSYAENFL